MLPLPLPLAPTLAGFRGIRGDVLVAVKKSQPVTAKELAAEFGLTPNAVRRHLKELEAEGLVGCARQVRGVGGPMLGYSLTEAGREEVAGAETSTPWEPPAAGSGAGFAALPKAGIELAQTASQVARTGSPKQVQEAVKVLDEARRRLYSILAQD